MRKFFRRGKFNAKPTMLDGRRFASKSEAGYYTQLKLLERCGEITNLTLQPRVKLTKYVTYVPDFSYSIPEDGIKLYVDVKGFQTPEFKIKKNLWREFGPANLLLVKRNGPFDYIVVETVRTERRD